MSREPDDGPAMPRLWVYLIGEYCGLLGVVQLEKVHGTRPRRLAHLRTPAHRREAAHTINFVHP